MHWVKVIVPRLFLLRYTLEATKIIWYILHAKINDLLPMLELCPLFSINMLTDGDCT